MLNTTLGNEDEIINGLLLSDATISKSSKSNSRLLFVQSIKNKDFVHTVKKYLKHLRIRIRINEYNVKRGNIKAIHLTTERSEYFTKLRKRWYSDRGKKIIPNDLILTPKTIAYWYMGDGLSQWVKKKTKQVRIELCTEGFMKRDVMKIKSLLKKIGFENLWLRKRPSGLRIAITKSNEVDKFFKMVEQYIIPSFGYKIKKPIVRSISEAMKEVSKNYKRDDKGRFIMRRGLETISSSNGVAVEPTQNCVQNTEATFK